MSIQAPRSCLTSHLGEQRNVLFPEFAAAEYTVPLTEPEGTDAEWNSLLSHLESRADALAALRESCTVTLRLYIQSDYAQIAYRLSPETMGKLVALGMPLSISSLSWGEVAI